MKILYAVQATGNGHISRAMELLPYLKKYGKTDIFLSGANSTLKLDAPVRFRSKGLCLFYNSTGGLDYLRTMSKMAPVRMMREVRDLPVEKYDLVLNDFESITALACAYKKVFSVNFGHQASFQSDKTPRPEKKDWVGEWVLRNFARSSQYIGLHFKSYDDFILPPVIKKEILEAEPEDHGYFTVYLSSYNDQQMKKLLAPLSEFRFEVFSRQVSSRTEDGHISFIPVSREGFNQSMIHCHGILTGAGFETPAEALYLGKKLMVVPIHGQYEQYCNAEALMQMGVTKLEKLDENFADAFYRWVGKREKISYVPDHSTEAIVNYLMHHCTGTRRSELRLLYPELVI